MEGFEQGGLILETTNRHQTETTSEASGDHAAGLFSFQNKSKSNPRRRITMTKTLTPATTTDLVVIENDKPMTTSLEVAEVFGKDHNLIMRAIRDLECSDQFIECNFALSSYQPAGAKRSYPMYKMTRDGFSFLAMGFTGARAAQFKEWYIAEFNRMEAGLYERSAPKLMSPIEMLEFQIEAIKKAELKAVEAY